MSTTKPTFRVLLVEGQQGIREALGALLRSRPEYDVIAECGTIATALKALSEHRPDLVITGFRMPDGDGVTLVSDVQGVRWEVFTVVLSTDAADDDQVAAARAGARACLSTHAPDEETLDVIARVMDGENVLRRTLTPALKARLLQKDLTPREEAVLACVGLGISNKEICVRLGAAENTVKVHLRRIFLKLGVNNRAEAAAIAQSRGLVG